MNFKKYAVHLIAVVVMLIIAVVYFMPQFQGKRLQMGDIVSNQGMANESREFREKTGEATLWTNSMFGGMPTYNISSPSPNNVAKPLERILKLGISGPAGMFLMGMISFYICMLVLGVNPWVSLIMSILFSFSTSNLMLTGAGHNTKVRTIMLAAPIIAGVILTLRGRYILGGFIFTLFMALSVQANHPQMIYYLGLALGIYMIFALVDAIQKKTLKNYGISVGIFIVGSLLALGASASKLLPTYEYSKQTMRGEPILETTSAPSSSSETKGLEWNYAMNWSGGMLDAFSLFIPRAAGGGTVEELSGDSNFAKLTGQRRGVSAPVYFGSLPSTAGPYYFGAILFFLFLFGALTVPGKVKWWLVTAVLFTVLISFGKNFEGFNRILFDYFPMFNKFRTPNSVFSITGILITILAGLGFNNLIKAEDKSQYLKPLYISGGTLGLIALLFAFVGPSMIDFSSAYDARMGDPRLVDALIEDRIDLLTSSAYRVLLLTLIATGLVWAYLKSYINQYVLIIGIGLVAIFDQFQVSSNYFNKDSFVNDRQYKAANFSPRPVDEQILQDKDLHYRVQDFTVDTYNSASTSYFHKTIGGYHPAKLQRIQDVIDHYLANRTQENPFGNQRILNMLNTKYFILPSQNNQAVVQQNPSANGNAWFVSDIEYVNTPNEEIDALADFDPIRTAVISNEFKDYVSSASLSGDGSIQLTSYEPNKLEYTSTSSAEQLAVFSEVWYGPDLGWNAYIDGEKVEHIRANYLLRALKIPAGQHTIVFEFKPKSFENGKLISLISSICIVLLGGFAGYQLYNKNKNTDKDE